MPEYIEREALRAFPIRADHCDKEHANEHFIYGIETVLEYAENLPAADVAPVSWISVKDKLPKTETEVLVVCRCLQQRNRLRGYSLDAAAGTAENGW